MFSCSRKKAENEKLERTIKIKTNLQRHVRNSWAQDFNTSKINYYAYLLNILIGKSLLQLIIGK